MVGDTAAWCQSNLMWGSKIQTLSRVSGAPFTVTAHPEASQTTFLLFHLLLILSMLKKKQKTPLNHSGSVCQQVVSSHKSSYAHLRYSLCREIPQGSGSTSANTYWKRDPPAGKLERQTWQGPYCHDTSRWKPRRQLDPNWDLNVVNIELLTDTTEWDEWKWIWDDWKRCERDNLFSLSDRRKWSAMTRVVFWRRTRLLKVIQTQLEAALQPKCQLQRSQHELSVEPGGTNSSVATGCSSLKYTMLHLTMSHSDTCKLTPTAWDTVPCHVVIDGGCRYRVFLTAARCRWMPFPFSFFRHIITQRGQFQVQNSIQFGKPR